MRVTNENCDSCNSYKCLEVSRLHVLHELKFSFVTRIGFILSKLTNFSAYVSGVSDCWADGCTEVLTAPQVVCRGDRAV